MIHSGQNTSKSGGNGSSRVLAKIMVAKDDDRRMDLPRGWFLSPDSAHSLSAGWNARLGCSRSRSAPQSSEWAGCSETGSRKDSLSTTELNSRVLLCGRVVECVALSLHRVKHHCSDSHQINVLELGSGATILSFVPRSLAVIASQKRLRRGASVHGIRLGLGGNG